MTGQASLLIQVGPNQVVKRMEDLKSFDEFLERRFPGSRRKAYYLMSTHEHLPPQARKQLKEVGWTKGLEVAKLARIAVLNFRGPYYRISAVSP